MKPPTSGWTWSQRPPQLMVRGEGQVAFRCGGGERNERSADRGRESEVLLGRPSRKTEAERGRRMTPGREAGRARRSASDGASELELLKRAAGHQRRDLPCQDVLEALESFRPPRPAGWRRRRRRGGRRRCRKTSVRAASNMVQCVHCALSPMNIVDALDLCDAAIMLLVVGVSLLN